MAPLQKKANRAALARRKAGLSIGQAAMILGIEKEYLVVVEEMDPAQADFDFNKLADVYGCRVEWITGEVEQHDYKRLDEIDGSDRLTPHDRNVVAEFIAMLPRKPAKSLAQVARERGHTTAELKRLETEPLQFLVVCTCGWQSNPVRTEEQTADRMTIHLIDVGAIK